MQAIQAPFALEQLGCSGAEARLVDCPVSEDGEDYSFTFRDYGYVDPPAACDPFGQSYAYVACGSAPAPSGPSAPPQHPYMHP